MLSVILFLRLIIHTSTVISRLQTIQIIVYMDHFHFTALFEYVQFQYGFYMKVEYRIFIANYVRHNGKRMLVYKKLSICAGSLAFISNELIRQ